MIASLLITLISRICHLSPLLLLLLLLLILLLLLCQHFPLVHAALAVLFRGPDALQGLDPGANVAGLAARVVAPRETAVVGVFAAVDNELEVAHRGIVRSKR